MSVSLSKKVKVSRNPAKESLEFIAAGIRWDARSSFGNEYDLDISCFMLGKDRKAAREADFIFYNNPESLCGAARHECDNCTGDGEDETILVDLPGLSPDISSIVFAVSIHEAGKRDQVFGMIPGARFYVLNRKNNEQILYINLREAFREESAALVCMFYRAGKEWKFRSLEDAGHNSLAEMAAHFGIEAMED